MREKEVIVYEGKAFTVEWYYDTGGKSESFEHYQALDTRQRAKFLALLRVFEGI